MADVKGLLDDDMPEEDFFNFCLQNKTLRFERDHNKKITLHLPVGLYTSAFNSAVTSEVYLWNRKLKLGNVVGSGTGFSLPDSSVFSPNVAWIAAEKMNRLTEKQKVKFAPVCPDFVIELKSKPDNFNTLKNKMLKWIENGTRLAWLIDTANKQVFIYRADDSIEIIKGFNNKLSGENVLPGFKLDLQILQ